MTPLYPVLLDLREVAVLVVGGGTVASRKVQSLVQAGGRPTVIAPEVSPELGRQLQDLGLVWQARRYRDGDARGFALVIAATDSSEVNAAVAADARSNGGWVNVVDDPSGSTFQLPAALREGEILVTLSTGGASPLLSRRLRERLEHLVTPGLGRAAERLREARRLVRDRWPDDEQKRRAFWLALINDQFLDAAIAGRDEEVQSLIEACLSQF